MSEDTKKVEAKETDELVGAEADVEMPKDAKLKEATQRGLNAAKQERILRKAAPDGVTVGGGLSVPQKRLIAKYAALDGSAPDGKFHYMFGDRKLYDQYPDQGYVPVVINGKHEQYMGDDAWKIATDIWTGRCEAEAERGRRGKARAIAASGESPVVPKDEHKVTTADGLSPEQAKKILAEA